MYLWPILIILFCAQKQIVNPTDVVVQFYKIKNDGNQSGFIFYKNAGSFMILTNLIIFYFSETPNHKFET